MHVQSKGWCKDHLSFAVASIARHGLAGPDFYEFGVYRGETVQMTENLFEKHNLPLRQGWGFDSFEGLPDEAPDVPKFYVFQKGAFNDVHPFFPNRCTRFIKGWFSDLKDGLVRELDMKPAALVHVDCDLYISTLQALDWMFRNGLVVPGTVVCYDEFKSTNPLWAGGEARAHKEIAEKYGVGFEEFFRNVYTDRIECWQSAFVVKGVAGTPSHGVNGVD